MSRDKRWWLRDGHRHAQCTAERKDRYFTGRCKNKATLQGLCRTHAKLADLPLTERADDMLRRLQAQSFRNEVKRGVPPTAWEWVDAALDLAVKQLERERDAQLRDRPRL